MSMPGWYPDPSGQNGQFRYWNGSTWSAETTADPSRTPAPGGGGSGYDKPSNGRGGRIAAVLIGVLVVALVVWFAVRQFGGNDDTIAGNPDTNTATPTISAWDETSSPSATPSSPKSSGATMVDCPEGESSNGQRRDGRLWGGGISVESLGWQEGGISLAWVHDIAAETKQITPSWFSVSAVGALSVADGFEVPEASARAMMSCFASSGYYRGFTGRKDVISEAVTIDGHKGFHLRSEIYVDDQGPNIKGDVVDVVVLDIGSPESLAIYFSSATIDDSAVISEIDRARGSIKVG